MSPTHLITRDQFREGVFKRDGNACVFCKAPAVNAHHLIERRLWDDGGYHLLNGISVCAEHHIECEKTLISVEDARHAAGITKIIVPSHMYPDQPVDKWGNPILPNGTRMRGELFYDESVQKILKQAGLLDIFTHFVKYGRSYHCPWSEGMHEDDEQLRDMSNFVGKRVVVSTKLDGENTSMYRDGIHARSLDTKGGPERDWVKRFHSTIAHDIPEYWRVCGENLYEKHSIGYDNLPSFFMGFSVWDERNNCLDWDSTLEWFGLLGIVPVPVLYDGIYDEKLIRGLWNAKTDYDTCEGYVIRLAESFHYSQFRRSLAKFVRADHVQTSHHVGQRRFIIPNKLASS